MSRSKLMAIVFLTWKAALRYRFFWVMLVMLAFTIGGIPLLVKDDGSAEGMTQILITYTLSMIPAILGAATLWVSAGSLATEIENYQLQMVVTKPIPRWQIWLGKWLGVMSMNFILLLFAGGVVYGMVEYRAKKLTRDALEQLEDRQDMEIYRMADQAGIPPIEFNIETGKPILDDNEEVIFRDIKVVRREVAGIEEKRLRQSVLIARASMQINTNILRRQIYEVSTNMPGSRSVPLGVWVEELVDTYWPQRERELIQAKFEKVKERNAVIKQRGGELLEIPEGLDSFEELKKKNEMRSEVLGYSQQLNRSEGVSFEFKKPFGWNEERKKNVVLRLYFEDINISFKNDDKYPIYYQYAPGREMRSWMGRELDARSYHEIPLPGFKTSAESESPMFFDDNEIMTVALYNGSPAKLKVPFLDAQLKNQGDGVEVLYEEASFSVNYMRALGIVFAWLGALAALGLFAASFMSFAMSAFTCLGVLIISFCVGLMQDVVEDGTVMQTYTEGQRDSSYVDSYAVPAFKVMISMIKPVKDYSPIEKLTEGRSITWGELMRAYGYIWGVSGLTLGVLGSFILSRRQLAITSTNGGGS